MKDSRTVYIGYVQNILHHHLLISIIGTRHHGEETRNTRSE